MSTSVPPPSRNLPGPRKLIAAGLVLAAAVAVVFVLLSSGSSPVGDPIARAANTSSGQPGFRLNFKLNVASSSLPTSITGSGSGSVDSRDRATSMTMAMKLPEGSGQLGSSPLQFDIVGAKGVYYMKFPSALANAIPSLGGKPWVKIDLAKASGIPGASSLFNNPVSSNPANTLEYLRASSDSVTNEGQEQVNGIQTTHYRAEVSLTRVSANVPAAERATVRAALAKLKQLSGRRDLPIDVWIDGQNLVRRMAMKLSVNAGGTSLQENIDMTISGYGPQPKPTPPPADQVTDITALANAGSSSVGG